jgi:uncharacterized membrane protein HdeD (DUF308 family)
MAEEIRDNLADMAVNARGLCKRTWWVFLIGGIASVIFGILAFVNPAVALLVLSVYFAAYVLVDGVVNIVGAIQNREKDGWWVLLLIGVLGTLVGAYALLNPPVSMAALVYLVAFMAILMGTLLFMLGRKVREKIEREWVLYLCGILSILWGVLIVVQPDSGAVSVVYMIASWAIMIGVLRIVFAFKAKGLAENVGERVAAARNPGE